MKAFGTTALTAALTISTVAGHGQVLDPPAKFKNEEIATKYEAILTEQCDPAFQGKKWNDNPEKNTATFTAAFKNSKFKDLRSMLDAVAPTCGNTRTDVPPVDVSGKKELKFANEQEKSGFVSSHHGPCEIWIDQTRVFQGDDCRQQFDGYPASIPTDYSKCQGECTLTFYWLALHEANWQVYKQCVPIKNGAGDGNNNNNNNGGGNASQPPSNNGGGNASQPPAYNGGNNNNNNNNNNQTPAPANNGGNTEYPQPSQKPANPVTPGSKCRVKKRFRS